MSDGKQGGRPDGLTNTSAACLWDNSVYGEQFHFSNTKSLVKSHYRCNQIYNESTYCLMKSPSKLCGTMGDGKYCASIINEDVLEISQNGQ